MTTWTDVLAALGDIARVPYLSERTRGSVYDLALDIAAMDLGTYLPAQR